MTLPSGTITFLFSDIEASTRLWEEHPEAMREALARHDALVRQAIEDNSGVIFKTVGDAFCAAFATAPDALIAALKGQCILHVEPWPNALVLRVRMALHTGTAERRDNDYFGQPLNRVARLLAIGHGGQVLISAATQELTRDTLPAGSHLHDVGEHRLRDLGRPEAVFQLLHPDLSVEFPPLKSLNNPALPNNLPQQVTSFIGREKETEVVKSLLGKTRLLTLTGSGGCGKTRLALQVAAEVLENYPDGAWLVELAPLVDTALIPQAIADCLGVREEPTKPLVQTLVDALKTRRALLILDNCEHLLTACAHLVNTVIRTCLHIQILASSREGLGIAGELTYRIPSLSLPDLKQAATVSNVSQYEAVQLFIERALFHMPAFAVTSQNAPALASVCHRLDGIPLAIELAAARVRSLAVEEIDGKLNNRFRLLTGGSRTALPRQQTLRALIDWSYDLLNAQEKLLLCRLAVFAGGWTLEAAETVGVGNGIVDVGTDIEAKDIEAKDIEAKDIEAKDIEEWEVFDLLTSLTDKSLVVAEQCEEHTRYCLLETVRQYAQDRLVERREDEIVRERHQAFFVALAEKAEPQLLGPEGAIWLQRLENEHDNLRAALEGNNQEAALRMASALYRFWEVRGHYTEGRKWLAGSLSSPSAQARTPVRAKALNGAGMLAYLQCDFTAAQALQKQSLTLYQDLEDKQGIANSLGDLVWVAGVQGDAATQALIEQSLALYQEVGDKRGIANSLRNLGLLTYGQGDYLMAQTLIEQSLTLYQEVGDKRGIAFSLLCLGIGAYAQGDYATARSLFEQSLTLNQALGDKRGIAFSLLELGNVANAKGDFAVARPLYEQSLTLFEELKAKFGIAYTLEAFAALASAQKQTSRTATLWGAAEALREGIGCPLLWSERVRYDSLVAQARSEVHGNAFDIAWAQGRAMPLEQAIAYALSNVAEGREAG